MVNREINIFFLIASIVIFLSPGTALGYDGNVYDRGPYYGDDPYRAEREQRELERERLRLQDERERLESERRLNESRGRFAPEKAPAAETCPQGFHPGTHRCSPEDRKRGCKDMKMPGGTTCNAGPFS